MKKDTVVTLDKQALEKEVCTLKKELLDLHLNASTVHVKDYSQFKKLRKRVARLFTLLKQRQQGNAQGLGEKDG